MSHYHAFHYGGTLPVGSFPRGATPEGIYDLSGNVKPIAFEMPAPTGCGKAAKGRRPRVLRGSSWSYTQDVRRAASKWVPPLNRPECRD